MLREVSTMPMRGCSAHLGRPYAKASETDRQRNKSQKNILKPHLREQSLIPPDANAAFVVAMEDLLAVYICPHDPDCPAVCLDEAPK